MAEKQKPWSPAQMIWSALGGAALWTAVGFSWFGQGFNWSTQGHATEMSAIAVAESLASICVAQAQGAPDSKQALEKFAGLSDWKQAEFVGTAQWATMPGSDSPQSRVIKACVVKLRET